MAPADTSNPQTPSNAQTPPNAQFSPDYSRIIALVALIIGAAALLLTIFGVGLIPAAIAGLGLMLAVVAKVIQLRTGAANKLVGPALLVAGAATMIHLGLLILAWVTWGTGTV